MKQLEGTTAKRQQGGVPPLVRLIRFLLTRVSSSDDSSTNVSLEGLHKKIRLQIRLVLMKFRGKFESNNTFRQYLGVGVGLLIFSTKARTEPDLKAR